MTWRDIPPFVIIPATIIVIGICKLVYQALFVAREEDVFTPPDHHREEWERQTNYGQDEPSGGGWPW